MKNKKTRIILLSIILMLTISLTAGGAYIYNLLNKVTIVKIDKSDKALGIKPRLTTPSALGADTVELSSSDDVTNIALFGVDTRTGIYEAKHSDSIMILTIDKKHKKLKLSSFLRDLYVNIDGHDKNKINTAYAYGGPQLAIKTLNKNFNMNIKDYVTANFSGLSDIIDEVGGLYINVKDKELQQVNKYMREAAKLKGERPTPVLHGGYQLLNGNQAQAYARIRKVGNGDFERTERQKIVLTTLFSKIKSKNLLEYPGIANKLLSCLETSMDKPQMIGVGSEMLKYKIDSIDWCRFPIDGNLKAERVNKQYVITSDISKTTDHIHKFIYDDIKTTPISKKIAKKIQ